MKNLMTGLFLALGCAFFFTNCDKNDDPVTIVGLAQDNADLSILVEAVTHAGLVETLNGSTEYTVFAPTNAAFNSLLTTLGVSKITDVDKEVVKQILLYHTVAGTVRSTDLKPGYVSTAATFGSTSSPLSLLVSTTPSATLNKDTKITSVDIEASNGVVHVIDRVLTLPTIVTTVVNNPDFSILASALTRPGIGVDYVAALSATGPFTVFAPNNAAFTALLSELGISSLDAVDNATLNAVLQYHVVSGANVLSTQLTDEQQVTTFGGSKFKVDLTGGAKIVDGQNRITNIIATDVQTNNGVVHVIDRVLRP